MTIRAFKARIVCDRETLLDLWRTHKIFNERTALALREFFRLMRGEIGDTPEQWKIFAAFGEVLQEFDAKNTYDPVLKACQRSNKDASSHKQFKGLLDKHTKSTCLPPRFR